MAIDIIARGMVEESSSDVEQLSEKVNSHTENSDIHVTTVDKNKWNGYSTEINQNKTDILNNKNDISQLFDITKGGETVTGESSYTLTDAVDYPLLGLSLYGKSTQDGTPTPETPVDIISVGDSGSVTITVDNGDSISATAAITSALPLCGIPVDSGGNYTDSNGQQWICDELVYNADGSGKIIKRTKKTTITSDITPEYDGVSIKDSNVHIFDYSYSKLGMTDYKFYNTNYITIEMNMGKMLTKFMARTDASVDSFKYLADGEFGTNTLNADRASDNYLEIGTSKASTVEEFKALINGCEIVYILATPQEIELTAADVSALMQLRTYIGVTNISNSGNAEMDVKYCTDKSLSEYVMPVITNMQAQIDELKSAVLSLGGNI